MENKAFCCKRRIGCFKRHSTLTPSKQSYTGQHQARRCLAHSVIHTAILQWLQWGEGRPSARLFVKELTSLCSPHGQVTLITIVTMGGGATFSQVVCERVDKSLLSTWPIYNGYNGGRGDLQPGCL